MHALDKINDAAIQRNRDRIRGSLIGGAIGDALGYPVEFMTWGGIRQEYGERGIQEYELDARTGKALITDDTQMTLFTACGLLYGMTHQALKGSSAAPSDWVYRAYLDWLTTQSRGPASSQPPVSWILSRKELHAWRAPGGTCLNSLSSGDRGTTAEQINNSKGCGSVMRVAPMGLLHPELHGAELAPLDCEAAETGAITHGHPLGYIPCAFLAHAIHEAAFSEGENVTLRGIVEEALATTERIYAGEAHFASFRELIHRAMEYADNGKPDVENIHALGGGWVADEAAAIGIYCVLRHEDSFTDAMIAAVNHSGDSDSTGAIAGNLLGAWIGYAAIEDKWKKDLELSDVILELADDLCRSATMSSEDCDEAWREKYASIGSAE